MENQALTQTLRNILTMHCDLPRFEKMTSFRNFEEDHQKLIIAALLKDRTDFLGDLFCDYEEQLNALFSKALRATPFLAKDEESDEENADEQFSKGIIKYAIKYWLDWKNHRNPKEKSFLDEQIEEAHDWVKTFELSHELDPDEPIFDIENDAALIHKKDINQEFSRGREII